MLFLEKKGPCQEAGMPHQSLYRSKMSPLTFPTHRNPLNPFSHSFLICIYIYIIYIYIIYIYIYIRTISSQNTRNQILMKWIYYTRKTKIRCHPKNWDFTGKYHHEMSFSTKPWNDSILRAVILHCVIFAQVRKQYKFENRFFC